MRLNALSTLNFYIFVGKVITNGKETQQNKSSSRRERYFSNRTCRGLSKSFSTVNAYCANRQQPSLEVLADIAKFLSVSMKDLIVDDVE